MASRRLWSYLWPRGGTGGWRAGGVRRRRRGGRGELGRWPWRLGGRPRGLASGGAGALEGGGGAGGRRGGRWQPEQLTGVKEGWRVHGHSRAGRQAGGR
jgi:hypothetical protein